jgi:hypothetical protein
MESGKIIQSTSWPSEVLDFDSWQAKKIFSSLQCLRHTKPPMQRVKLHGLSPRANYTD